MSRLFFLFCVGALWGCASAPSQGNKAQHNKEYPSAAELDALVQVAPVASERSYNRKLVAEWRLDEPLTDVISYRAREPDGALERALIEAAKTAKILEPQISEGANCHARQLGQFYLEHEAFPHRGLESFMASRCGMSVSWPSSRIWDLSDESLTTEADVATRLNESLSRAVAQSAEKRSRYELGIWRGRHKGRHIVMMVLARRNVELEPFSVRADSEGMVVLRGRSLHDRWVDISAAFTVSDFEFGRCESDKAVKAPEFVLRCELNRGDRDTRLDLWGSRTGRFLSTGISDLVLWPQIEPDATYHAPLSRQLLREVELDEAAPLLEQAQALLNHVRAHAGLGALRISEPQSRTLGKLAPHYFEADDTLAGDELQDKLALGFMAGWDVGEPILHADFTSGGVQRRDLRQWLTQVLESSNGRRALLDPSPGILALGTYAQGDTYSFIVARYTTPPVESYAARLERANRMIQRWRRANGLSSLRWNRQPQMSEDIVRDIERGEMSWEDAKRLFWRRVTAREDYTYHYVWFTSSLDEGHVSSHLNDSNVKYIDAMVALQPYDVGHPWHVYVINITTKE